MNITISLQIQLLSNEGEGPRTSVKDYYWVGESDDLRLRARESLGSGKEMD